MALDDYFTCKIHKLLFWALSFAIEAPYLDICISNRDFSVVYDRGTISYFDQPCAGHNYYNQSICYCFDMNINSSLFNFPILLHVRT